MLNLNKSITTIISISTMTLMGCSGSYKKPESIESKIKRYDVSNIGLNKVPEFNIDIEVNSSNRGPASVRPVASKEKVLHSNKRLYFLTLFEQYNHLKQFASVTAPEVSICPNFHTSLMQHKEKFGKQSNSPKKLPTYKWVTSAKDLTGIYPELNLPVSKTDIYPKAWDMIVKKENIDKTAVVQNALNIHIEKTYSELKELCEFGVSDNYYNFENLLTYTKKKTLGPSTKSLNSLVKTTIFSNWILLDSIDKSKDFEKKKVLNTYTSEVVNRLKVDWARNAIHQLRAKR